MAQLVTYSSSSNSSSDEECPPAEKQNTTSLTLPDSIRNMFNECDHIESKEDHEGRERGFAHMRGNWPTYVYITIKFHDDFETLLSLFHKDLSSLILSYNDSKCPTVIHTFNAHDLHLSLSRTVPLQYHWINPINSKLNDFIEKHNKFLISFHDLVLYSNDNKTRSFIGLSVTQGYNELSSIVDDVDCIFDQFKLPPFYKERSFHVSLYWTLGDITTKLTHSMINNLKKCWTVHCSKFESLQDLTVQVASVHCKIGNKLFSYKLD